jgi:hypothetical protein
MKIDDGTGSGKQAKVDGSNRLVTLATTKAELEYISEEDGQAFVISHGDYITISTTGTETGILHVKNTSTNKNFHVSSIRTCGTQIQKWKLYKNSTGGTVLSDQTAGSSQNLNITSANTADLTVYKGADAKTVSGGTMMGHHINDIGHSEDLFEGSLILGTNDSLELTVELASGGDICCRVVGYFK